MSPCLLELLLELYWLCSSRISSIFLYGQQSKTQLLIYSLVILSKLRKFSKLKTDACDWIAFSINSINVIAFAVSSLLFQSDHMHFWSCITSHLNMSIYSICYAEPSISSTQGYLFETVSSGGQSFHESYAYCHQLPFCAPLHPYISYIRQNYPDLIDFVWKSNFQGST